MLVADILDGLGKHERASWIMAGVEPLGPEPPDDPRIDAIYALLDEIPSSTDKHTHVEDAPAVHYADGKITRKATHACWRSRAQCLAERIRGMIDNDREMS